MVAVQLMDGRPQVLVEGEAGPVKLEISTPLHDGEWHVIHLQLDSRVSLFGLFFLSNTLQ